MALCGEEEGLTWGAVTCCDMPMWPWRAWPFRLPPFQCHAVPIGSDQMSFQFMYIYIFNYIYDYI